MIVVVEHQEEEVVSNVVGLVVVVVAVEEEASIEEGEGQEGHLAEDGVLEVAIEVAGVVSEVLDLCSMCFYLFSFMGSNTVTVSGSTSEWHSVEEHAMASSPSILQQQSSPS